MEVTEYAEIKRVIRYRITKPFLSKQYFAGAATVLILVALLLGWLWTVSPLASGMLGGSLYAMLGYGEIRLEKYIGNASRKIIEQGELR